VIVALTLVGFLCGLASAALVLWWWSAQPRTYSVITDSGEFTGFDREPTFTGGSFYDLFEAEGPPPWLFAGIVTVTLLIGLLSGLVATRFGWRGVR
jgi:hypothetical protein